MLQGVGPHRLPVLHRGALDALGILILDVEPEIRAGEVRQPKRAVIEAFEPAEPPQHRPRKPGLAIGNVHQRHASPGYAALEVGSGALIKSARFA